MDGYIDSFRKLAGSAKATPKGAEDYFDRLNYVVTPALLLAIATVVGMKQYVFEPIQCWNLKELDNDRMEYAENYCWVENTFYYDPTVPIHHGKNPGEGRTIYYYQWVPFILMAQAALFYVPHLIWLLLSTNVGIDMRQLALQARNIEADSSGPDERQKKIAFLSDSLLKFIRYRSRYRHKDCCKRFASFLSGKPAFSMYFAFTYIFVKSCYVANCIGQLYLMRSFLGLNITSFGLQILSDIANNRTWQSSNVFPRVTYCQFETRSVGEPRQYTLQCVLPVNMLNEKFYIAIWFWVVILLTLSVVSASRWLLQLLLSPSRHRAIKKYLKIAENLDMNPKPTERFQRIREHEPKFVSDFLRTDGHFMLSVVNKNSGDIVTAEVVKETFLKWLSDATLPDRSTEDGHSVDMQGLLTRASIPQADLGVI
ncbi:hypothetical protein BOX15_Mlig014591g2 [Macrostomum lignano]|uniref:Innexin n=1 Tax=Macrostomum lignano TaxID=282301 RepID=A0A267G7P8_9PLAT|nr:hypothetical protein BOX15_Mlig014591g2 [Macrostomum lignano]